MSNGTKTYRDGSVGNHCGSKFCDVCRPIHGRSMAIPIAKKAKTENKKKGKRR